LRPRILNRTLCLAIILFTLGCREETPPSCVEIDCLTDTIAPVLSCTDDECTAIYKDKMHSFIPTQQLGVALELARRNPNGTSAHLCGWLTRAIDRESCDVWHRRPHLWTPLFPSRPLQPPQRRAADGTPAGECSKHDAPAACILQLAVNLGEVGSLEEIKRHCRSKVYMEVARKAGLTPIKLTHECFFVAADAISRRTMSESRDRELSSNDIGTAVQLCREAGEFTSQCLMHQAQQISKIQEPELISTLAQAGARALDETGAQLVGDAFWSMTWALSLSRGGISGAPLAEARSALWYNESLPTEINPQKMATNSDSSKRRGRCVALDENNWRPFHPSSEIDEVLALLAEAARQDRASSLLIKALKYPSKEVQRATRSWLELPPHQPLGCKDGAVESFR
jgi:hypothetical protein